jgi:hypothetical protein
MKHVLMKKKTHRIPPIFESRPEEFDFPQSVATDWVITQTVNQEIQGSYLDQETDIPHEIFVAFSSSSRKIPS